MKTVKKTDKYEILQKRSGRYGVRGVDRKWINGDDKLTILVSEGLAKAPPKKEEPAPEATEAAEAPAE